MPIITLPFTLQLQTIPSLPNHTTMRLIAISANVQIGMKSLLVVSQLLLG